MSNLSTSIDCQCGHEIPLTLNLGPRERRQIILKCPACNLRYKVAAKSEIIFRLQVDSVEPLQEESKGEHGSHG